MSTKQQKAKVDKNENQAESGEPVQARKNKGGYGSHKGNLPGAIKINTISDVRRLSKLFLNDIINQTNRFSQKDINNYNKMARLLFDSDEYCQTKKLMKRLAKEGIHLDVSK